MVNSGHHTPDGCRPVAPDVCRRLSPLVRGLTRRRYAALFFVSGTTVGVDDGRVVRSLDAVPGDAVGLLRDALETTPAPPDDEAQYLVCDLEAGECWACGANAGLEFVTRHNRS